MSSTTSRSTGDVTPNPPAFSYAQAAKGRAAAASSGVTSNQATSGVSTPAKGTSSSINTPSGGSERGDQSVNGSIDTSHKVEHAVESNNELKIAASTKSTSQPGTPNLGSASTSTLPKEDKDDFTLVGANAVEPTKERSLNAGNVTEKSGEAPEGRKGKKGKKQKNAEREAAEKEKAVEEARLQEMLVPAPLPAVNFWAKRKEEAAKTTPHASADPFTSNDGPRSPESKRRGKSNGVEEGDKVVGSTQNGGIKDSPNTTKAQKKANESAGKANQDQTPKRAGPRGARVGDRDEKSPSTQLLPPVGDATSWPTPETALEEEKRKNQEKLEKDDTSSNKPRPKEKWQTLPYVPSVAFNTPLPSRGGRGRGGARGGRTEGGGRSSHANVAGTPDKAQNGSATATTSTVEADKRVSRDELPRAASLPPNSNKRPSSDPSGAKDQRKSVVASAEKPRGGASRLESSMTDIRNTSYGEQISDNNHDQQSTRAERAFKSEQAQGTPFDGQTPQRSGPDRKSESNLRGYEQGKDNHRERGDGRPERGGRGAFRGRGNHNFQNGQQHPAHIYTNGPQQANGYPIRQGSGPYSPPPQPPAFNNQYPVPPSRGRGGSRSQTIPNSAMYGRYPQNGGNSQHVTPLQTSYDYQPMQPMSAPPFNPYMDHSAVLSMVKMQLEYYFSIDNLCKDVYLRKHMDSQGFVFLTFISSFKRIQALTQEFDLLYHACHDSDIMDLIRGDDGFDRLRRKDGWEKWILPMEDRDESVRNAGPQYHHPAPRSQHMGQMMYTGNPAMSPPPFSPNGTEASFRTYGNGNGPPPVMNGLNGNGHAYHPETPLSAAVPDFAPGVLNNSTTPLDLETTFNDLEVANLTLVFSPNKGFDNYQPKHSSASRTFSNGSIDGKSIAEEISDDGRQGRTLTNGSRVSEASPESLRRSRSPFPPSSPILSSSPPVMWVKGQRQQAPVAEHNSRESYTSFRARALKNRDLTIGGETQGETHPDMKLLYEFWSHFLCRNFNNTMYTEFRQYAFEDATSKATSGLKNLISYYDEVLNSKKKVIPDTLARHYVDLVKAEHSDSRPAFQRLRAAWRNGALDMKSRKKIDNYVDPQLREELERAPKQKSDL